MLTAAITLDQATGWYIILAIVGYVVLVTMVASYGNGLGYPFFPLFVCALLLPFGILIVLLAVTIGAGPRKSTALYEGSEEDAAPRPRGYAAASRPRNASTTHG
jgi:hypothetical protein